ncbi:MAG: DUF4135 domain-containing protein, partial [Flavobacteriaceae bacterium]
PIILDHETIMQPFLDTSDYICNKEEFSHHIGKPMLLPMSSPKYGIANDNISGFGALVETSLLQTIRKISLANTDNCYRSLENIPLHDKLTNIPVLDGRKQRIGSFKKQLMEGFSLAYNVLLKNKDSLLKETGPVYAMSKCKQRFVFRPTKVYQSILEIVREPKYMKSEKMFLSRIELLSKAFDSNPALLKFHKILYSEKRQLMNGDVPIFNFYPESRNLYLPNGDIIVNAFKSNCIEDIKTRINRFGNKDFNMQLTYIENSLEGKYC